MATIVSSVFGRNSLQKSGIRQILEWHTDSTGKVHRRARRIPGGNDADAEMAAYAATLPVDLAAQEEETNLQGLFNGTLLPADLTFDWTDSGDEVKLVCISFMKMDIVTAIPIRPTIDRYTNGQIGAFFTAQERIRIRSHAGGLLAIEAQINQWNDDKEVRLGVIT